MQAVGEAEHGAGSAKQDEEQRRSNEPSVRAAGLLKRFDSGLMRLDDVVARVLPDELNPLARTGAVAMTTFIIACITGVLLLVWYRASVFHAFDSVAAMSEAPFTAAPEASVSADLEARLGFGE